MAGKSEFSAINVIPADEVPKLYAREKPFFLLAWICSCRRWIWPIREGKYFIDVVDSHSNHSDKDKTRKHDLQAQILE